ncbi:hypothetical protein Tco_1108796 [Tanacetum coccineum]
METLDSWHCNKWLWLYISTAFWITSLAKVRVGLVVWFHVVIESSTWQDGAHDSVDASYCIFDMMIDDNEKMIKVESRQLLEVVEMDFGIDEEKVESWQLLEDVVVKHFEIEVVIVVEE